MWKITLPKACVHKGDRGALQKPTLFKEWESPLGHTPVGSLELLEDTASFYPKLLLPVALLLSPLAEVLGRYSLPNSITTYLPYNI